MSTVDTSDLKTELNLETARISWRELERFFANGSALAVSPGLDLLDVATAMAQDRAQEVNDWLESGQLGPVSDDQALSWHQDDTELWALVIKPWVLVQESR
ncbi:DUF2288 domain-containing protein [Marinimicrobium sp. ABcell2]|uniref:DUF2288 domain-containing protein n=1 Tax=Marinimicrobium sp. ABcell2 TaxID=3069751 RepID=UPI0027B7493B|nr:DUF2288 domain-containing protein [Marinimicrobium sp. ABcell2]MDQ2076458.1 DUF2288 domain-containing protein [Marinimicrobium sp. ABcell2]